MIKKCKQCGKDFYVRPSHEKYRVHCSKLCMAKTYTQEEKYIEIGKKLAENQKGENHPSWKGGRTIQRNYIFVYAPQHPHKYHNKVREHRLVMEKFLGRILDKLERVHHKNGNTLDNRIENLHLCANESEHKKIHYKNRIINKEGRFI